MVEAVEKTAAAAEKAGRGTVGDVGGDGSVANEASEGTTTAGVQKALGGDGSWVRAKLGIKQRW